jgi:hypothetical protein
MSERGGGAVKEFMHRYLETVPHDTTVALAAERMGETWRTGRSSGCSPYETW